MGFEPSGELAGDLRGQLTCCLHLDDQDTAAARRLIPVLERKAGRILANGYPTGVEVCDAMVHGGPYPASTNFGATSVGAMAIGRFLRPGLLSEHARGVAARRSDATRRSENQQDCQHDRN